MVHLGGAVFFFCLFLLSHILSYRLKFIKFQIVGILVLSLLGLVFFIAFLLLLPILYGDPHRFADDLWRTNLAFTSITLYVLLCACYLSQVTVLQYGSPSMMIIDAIISRRDRGVTEEELEALFLDEELILPRLDDLLAYGHIGLSEGRYFLKPKGVLIVRIIRAYRKLLGRSTGG